MRIDRFNVNDTDFQAVNWKVDNGKILIRITGNSVKIAYDQQLMAAGVYFTFVADQTMVFDQPTALGADILYLQAVDNSAPATVEIFFTGDTA